MTGVVVSESSDDLKDVLHAPSESFALVIYKRDPEALDMAMASETELEKSGIDEIVQLPAPRFSRTGLVHLRSFLADRVRVVLQPSIALGEVHAALQAGDVTAAEVDLVGEARAINRIRWRARDAEEILRTGRLGQADVYIVTDAVAAGLVAPVERPAWYPGERESLKSWCTRRDVEDAARARIKAHDGAAHENAICRELRDMWHSAGKLSGTAGSIYQARH